MRIEIIRENKNLIDQVVKLGTKNSKTLGHFPEGAYIEHAHVVGKQQCREFGN